LLLVAGAGTRAGAGGCSAEEESEEVQRSGSVSGISVSGLGGPDQSAKSVTFGGVRSASSASVAGAVLAAGVSTGTAADVDEDDVARGA